LHTHTHTHTQAFYGPKDFVWDNPGELVPEETFQVSGCKTVKFIFKYTNLGGSVA